MARCKWKPGDEARTCVQLDLRGFHIRSFWVCASRAHRFEWSNRISQSRVENFYSGPGNHSEWLFLSRWECETEFVDYWQAHHMYCWLICPRKRSPQFFLSFHMLHFLSLSGWVLLQISEEQVLEKQLIKYPDASLHVRIRFNAAVPSRLANTPAAPRMYCQRIAP